MDRGRVEDNPWSRDDLKVVYHCEGAPEECYNCPESHRCNYVDNFGLKKRTPIWMFHLAIDLLKDNMRLEAGDVLGSYLSLVDPEFSETQEIMLRGITEGMPQTADLWRSLLVLLDGHGTEMETGILLREAIELFPIDIGLLYTFYTMEGT